MPSPPMAISSSWGREVNVTSSTMPMVKWFFGVFIFRLS